jgi:hypothetical protein
MGKRILITAGPVYGRLDDNKIVSNRSRGIWALKFADWLHEETKHKVVVLVPDLMEREVKLKLGYHDGLEIITHNGYESYRQKCQELAPEVDAAIMAAAVVNWIPEHPFLGKMPTNDVRMEIPFILAPRVIEDMKRLNPTMTLIGCKLLFSMDYDTLIDAAYHVVLDARCNAVVANDARIGLKVKYVVHQDKAVTTFEGDFVGLYMHLLDVIEDVHYKTAIEKGDPSSIFLPALWENATKLFDAIVNENREAFVSRGEAPCRCPDWWFPENRRKLLRRLPHGNGLAHHETCPKASGEGFVFGSVAVRLVDTYFLVSPREKGQLFTSKDAVVVKAVDGLLVRTLGGKATLNAPLLIRHLQKFPQTQGVVHLHEHHDGFPVVPYAPPGTVRDNERPIAGYVYNIEGHGVIASVSPRGKILRRRDDK